MQWLMLQQDHPEDYVIATGKQYSVRDFLDVAASELGIHIRWEGSRVDEKGYVDAIEGDFAPALTPGQLIVAVDPTYFRPTEVKTLLGDPRKARENLGWTPRIPFRELVKEMVQNDLDQARCHVLLQKSGFDTPLHKEQ
jgi:GDPmannose 4,6-dehydratase